jgi:mutator protein MutT
MDLVVPVVITILIRDGKVLFIRRAGKTFTGLLSLPGGKIDFGETIEEAALREFQEETGIQASFTSHLATIPEHIIEKGRVIKHLIIHLCELEHIKQTHAKEFHPEWIGLEELDFRKEEITPSDYLMIKEILLPRKTGTYYSLMEKSPSGYIQKEFRKL